ncbi:unnamed protein product [Eruca vesicaria subsp. sativa]|uniref:F-box associated beta-propeller type 1 domain-containing protein n=1 Tax=Eruca vesicaria subsp. sativa TaxID=29727 RepID=A0ABC8KRQ3_ERUVS|nr:unnamed protein product [Eruca vesicaria subsp. sativa]
MLPAESLVRLRLACKQLKALIKEDKFVYDHLDRSKVRFLRTDQTEQIVYPESKIRSDSLLMLCMWSTQKSSFAKLSFWNPLTRNINFVEPSTTQRQFRVLSEPPRRDYKILKFSSVEHNVGAVEIYEFNS